MSDNTATGDPRITIDALAGTLQSFGMRHAAKDLPQLIDNAEKEETSYRVFLNKLLMDEVQGRNARNRSRNYAMAHFPPNPKPLEEFDVNELQSGITDSQIHRLEEMNWVDAHGDLIFVGPPGVGKTTLAVGLGVKAIEAGYTVMFETMKDLASLFDNAAHDRKAGFRMKNLRKADVVIIDEIGYTPITREQANSFYNFISDSYGKTSLIFTTNKQVSDWSEIFGDKELTKALLDRVISQSRGFILDGPSYRLNHPLEL